MVFYEIIVYEIYFHIYVIEHTLILGGTLQTAQDTPSMCTSANFIG